MMWGILGTISAIGERERAKDGALQRNIDWQTKGNPGHIIGLCECEKRTEQWLRDPAPDGMDPPNSDIQHRQLHDYLTLRGDETSSVLLGVRMDTALSLELLCWDRRQEGTYTTKGGTQSAAHSRLLIGRVQLRRPVGFLGATIEVAVVHFHNLSAKKHKGLKNAHESYWPYLAEKLSQNNVKILMADMNMSVLSAVPSLRAQGIHISLAAFLPWRTVDGDSKLDSCGIYTVRIQCECRLYNGLDCFNSEGVLLDVTEPNDKEEGSSDNAEVAAGGTRRDQPILKFQDLRARAPGYPLTSYLPKLRTPEPNWKMRYDLNGLFRSCKSWRLRHAKVVANVNKKGATSFSVSKKIA